MSPRTKRYLGLELGGSRSSRTALVALEFYPAENKIFVSELIARIEGTKAESGDEVLLGILREYPAVKLGVNAPLSLPPCFQCDLPCPSFAKCEVESVVWMREESEREGLDRAKEPTPYTQRPVDIALRGRWRREYEVPLEDTLGSSRAPLAARIQYLRRHISEELLEVNPRLALVGLSESFDIGLRPLERYRNIEEGIEQRVHILERLGSGSRDPEHPSLFLYNSDLHASAKDLSVFDALLCALMAVYDDLELLEAPGFNPKWGRIAIPRRRRRERPADIGESL